jgi:hypothetical protein
MKKWLSVWFVLLLASAVFAADPVRQDININREWKFQFGDHPGGEAAGFDDSGWQNIGLPHSFSMPYFQSKSFYTGYGWYRKHLTVPAAWSAKRLFLEFAGAFQDAQVFVNGTPIGEHKGGYTGFSMEITSAVHAGDNVVAVRLNSAWNAQIAPRAGDHDFNGGIYRDVHLVVVDPLHVTWYGTWVTMPQVSVDSATVNVKTEVQNQNPTAKVCTVETTLLDPDGKAVAHFSSSQKINAGATLTFDQTSEALPKPKLWHPAHPFMYSAHTTVSEGGTVVDDYTTPFGIRWFKWTADRGFFLNGEHYYFHGANVHQDHAGWADATTDAGSYRDVKFMKDAGFDFIRGSHYPHHPAFADACDTLGVLFWSENCFWAAGGAQKEGTWTASCYPPVEADQAPFEQNVLDTLRDEIRIFRNHPSIVVWSMCNEVFFSAKAELPKTKALLTKEVELTHQLDPTRPAAIGGAQRQDIDKLGDVAGYNGDGARLFINPGIPSAVTEYGSVTSLRPGNYDGQFKRNELTATTPEYPWRSGQVIWCGFDYGTIFGPAAGSKGVVDFFRIPKRSWYWYRHEFLHIDPPVWPVEGTPAKLALKTDQSTIHGTDATEDAEIFVTVEDKEGKPLSNSPPVTLTIESGPGEFPTGRSMTFDPDSDIAIRDGQAAMEFRSYQGGTSILRASSPGLEDATLAISTTGEPAFVPGKTPLVADRPYVRPPSRPTASEKKMAAQNMALNRPCNSSGEAPQHTASLATDGNAATYWQAPDNKPGAWWFVDLEHPYTISSIEIRFPKAGAYQYTIETSTDAKTWTPLLDESKTTSTDKTRTESFPEKKNCEMIRVTFTGLPAGEPAAIAEVKVLGRDVP